MTNQPASADGAPDGARNTAVLDVDGTLADSTYHHAVAWRRAFADIDGPAPALWRLHRAIGMGGDRLPTAVAGQEVEDRLGDRLREAWEEEYAQLLDQVGLLPGARELVLELKEAGFTIALASSGKDRFTQHVLGLLDLPKGTLSAVTSSDQAGESKPEPDILEAAIVEAGGEIAFAVGDTPYDVAAAARAGAPCVALRTGGFGTAELQDAGAALIADEPTDLLGTDWAELARSRPPQGSDRAHSPLP